MDGELKEPKRRTLTGTVVSDKMDKTVTVQVTRVVQHPVYRKYMSRTKTYKAHDEGNECHVDDTVVIEETRPLSATKRWRVIERKTST